MIFALIGAMEAVVTGQGLSGFIRSSPSGVMKNDVRIDVRYEHFHTCLNT
jgi:hypothetical protein